MTAFSENGLSARLPPLRQDRALGQQSAAVARGNSAAGYLDPPADLTTFESILFLRAVDRDAAERCTAPEYFGDLNLDQVVDAVTAGREAYGLKPFYYAVLPDTDAIHYRHEVFRDLENASLYQCIATFAGRMRAISQLVVRAGKLYYALQRQAWLLDAVKIYGEAVRRLASDLAQTPLSSRGFREFRAYVAGYVAGAAFASLMDETEALRRDLGKVRYSILIRDNALTVSHYAGERDYSAKILETFDKFKQAAPKDYLVKFRDQAEMNHIEAKIAEFVAEFHSELFVRLHDYGTRRARFVDAIIGAFDREIQFYLAYIDHLAGLRTAGLRFCCPHISVTSKELFAKEAFDLALAHKLRAGQAAVVTNDFFLAGKERIIVVSGPNQGGKTTFARMFGQLHYLARLGCPVPGREARLFLFDRLFTHFEREEKVENLRGKLEDDLLRIHTTLERATGNSLVVLNEVFTSTTLQDEVFLSRKVMQTLVARGLICVWVTFVDELASFAEQTVSMVSTIVPQNPALRSFKVVRRPADGLAYAMAIAEKYRLTYQQLKERIRP